MPDKAKVEAFVAWECWKVNGEFSLELLRAFSSMCNGKGLPDKAKVECWKVNGKFSLELLQAFSSMCHGKGLPDRAKVEALKAWECWKVNGEFSLELLRAFSSMCQLQRLARQSEGGSVLGVGVLEGERRIQPGTAAGLFLHVSWQRLARQSEGGSAQSVGVLEGERSWRGSEFSLELLRAFSSMCHGKGLPDKAKVEALKAWAVLEGERRIQPGTAAGLFLHVSWQRLARQSEGGSVRSMATLG